MTDFQSSDQELKKFIVKKYHFKTIGDGYHCPINFELLDPEKDKDMYFNPCDSHAEGNGCKYKKECETYQQLEREVQGLNQQRKPML